MNPTYLKHNTMKELLKKVFSKKPTNTHVEPGETELDYINPEELKPKKKSSVKKENPIIKIEKKK